jgi:SAM-dependent methyltransferase
MNFRELFAIAMDRDIPKIVTKKDGIALNLGAGNKLIPGTQALDYPDWDADCDQIPYPDETVSIIHAYHFLEHCADPVKVLLECQRVLKPGGYMNICVPYYKSQMQFHDLDHKKFFCEETWKTLFNTPYYDKNKIDWKFHIGFNLICGIVERNLCLLTQLIKV